MVYSNKFAVCVKCKDGIAREIRQDGDDIVRLPFGTEYSLQFKNLNSRRAIVSVFVDGKDAVDGSHLVIEPNSYGEILGFLKGHAVSNRFKFIQKTDKIAKHRGDFIDDGLIRVSWRFEKPKPVVEKVVERRIVHETHEWPYWPRRSTPWWDAPVYGSDGSTCFKKLNDSDSLCHEEKTYSDQAMKSLRGFRGSEKKATFSYDKGEEGITVAGSNTHQGFDTTTVGELEEQEHVAVIHLKGGSEEGKTYKAYTEPKLVKANVGCPTCGTKNKSRNKFCSECGTNITNITR